MLHCGRVALEIRVRGVLLADYLLDCCYRARRIKCDETKPACLKCTTTGRHCDGYPVNKSSKGETRQLRPKGPPILQRPPILQIVALTKNPDLEIPGSDLERRSFHFFSIHTGAALTQSLTSDAWSQLVLQFSHLDPVMRSVAVAIGALNERFQINHVSTVDNPRANALHEFALLQYSKAIGRLRRRLSSSDEYNIEFMLIACLMLGIFEFMHGDDQKAIIHLSNGLSLLEEYANRSQLPADVLFIPTTRLGFISLLFGLVSRQASFWLSSPPLRHRLLAKFEPWFYTAALDTAAIVFPPQGSADEIYSSVEDVRRVLSRNYLLAVLFEQKVAMQTYHKTSDLSSTELVLEQAATLERMDRWSRATEILLDQLRPDIERKDECAVAILTIHNKTSFLLLIAALVQQKDAIYSKYPRVFAEINSMVRDLLQSPEDMAIVREIVIPPPPLPGEKSIPIFTFRAGLIQPLHFVATHCMDPKLCWEAIELLEARPWREGGWDSAVMAKIARRRVEKMGAQSPVVVAIDDSDDGYSSTLAGACNNICTTSSQDGGN